MKKFVFGAIAASVMLVGCSSQQLTNERQMVVDGQPMAVKVIDIPSFKIEIAPRKAICEVTNTAGELVETECLQYRQMHQKNFNSFNGEIQGFDYQPNHRYVLDVRQEAVTDEVSGIIKPVWILNKVVSQVVEPTMTQ